MPEAQVLPRNDTCPQAVRADDYARGALFAPELGAFEQHLSGCSTCFERYLAVGRPAVVSPAIDCRIVKEIGRGRFGVVYKAWWIKARPKLVALKVLHYPGEMEKHRFDREIAVLKRLESPWIVRCLDSGGTPEAMHYVMDFVEGVHLDEYLKAPSRSLTEKLATFHKICRAVADAHGAGVIHRDLKPKNIIVDSTGEPHVLDFGICSIDRVSWSTSARETITHTGDVIGTLRYMSPEQAWGGVAGAIDAHSDLWALGVMLYEIVTSGGYPYSLADTPERPAHEALLERIRKEMPRFPRLRHLPRGRDLEALLERCLAWEPQRRLGSAAQLAEDVDRYIRGVRVTTRRLSLRHRARRLLIGAATQSRATFWAVFVAFVMTTIWCGLWLLNVGWHAGVTGFSSLAVGATGSSREKIRVIGVTDDSADQVVEFASSVHLDAVTNDVTTWRGVHGLLMKRLAAARPRAVVWDYYFRLPREDDGRLVDGILSLESEGVPVILAAAGYRENGEPMLSERVVQGLGRRLRHGAIDTRSPDDRPGEFLLAVKREGKLLVPSITLVAFGALMHPEARTEIEWRGRGEEIELLYSIEPGAYLRERDRIALSRQSARKATSDWIQVGDLLATITLPLERPEGWAQRTTPYHELLTASDADLSLMARDRVLVIGDLRTQRTTAVADRHRVRYDSGVEETVPGCYLLADAVAGLLDRTFIRAGWPPPLSLILAALLGAVCGCGAPVYLTRTQAWEQAARRGLVEWGLAACVLVCVYASASSRSSIVVHLVVGVGAMASTMIGSLRVENARNRHRLAERSRREIESLQLSSGGTITVAR